MERTRNKADLRDSLFETGDSIRLSCPTCDTGVAVTIDALWRRESVVCPRGHPVHVASCAGLSEVASFLLDLDGLSRRFAG